MEKRYQWWSLYDKTASQFDLCFSVNECNDKEINKSNDKELKMCNNNELRNLEWSWGNKWAYDNNKEVNEQVQ